MHTHFKRKKKTGKNSRDPIISRINKSSIGIVSRDKIGNFLENFKTDILGSISEQIDTLKVQNNQKVENVALFIFCLKCRKKQALRECPLDLKFIETHVICAENHDNKECPSIPSLKVFYQEEVVSNEVDPLCFISKIPWKNQGFNTQKYA